MVIKETNAAHDLCGRTLLSGWKVIEKIEKSPHSTGAFFSVCYKVSMNGELCFLKAFDFAKFFLFELQDGKPEALGFRAASEFIAL